MANLLLSVMGAFAEIERAVLAELQRKGIAVAKQHCAYRGRKKALANERLLKCAAMHVPASQKPRPRVSSTSVKSPYIKTLKWGQELCTACITSCSICPMSWKSSHGIKQGAPAARTLGQAIVNDRV